MEDIKIGQCGTLPQMVLLTKAFIHTQPVRSGVGTTKGSTG